MSDRVPLKDQALNADRIHLIGAQVRAVLPDFDADAFATEALADFPQLELKARIARTSTGLRDYLPSTGTQALDVLLRSLPATPQAAGITNDFGLHLYSPHSDFVARYYRTSADLPVALDALRRMTCYFSAEDAVRYFLKDFPDQTMEAVTAWARDGDYRVRRLASESTRPRLPWSPRIALPADAALPVLDQLHTDAHRYVTRSVANHLNDIAVEDPDLVLRTLQRWRTAGDALDKELDFIAREALRNHLKQGWPPAYEFLGYPSSAPIEVSPVRLEAKELADGDLLDFAADLTANAPARLHVTYVISSTTLRGAPREKVYFLTKAAPAAGETLALAKQHSLRSTATTKITPGAYTLQIQVNGRRFPPASFEVVDQATGRQPER